MKPKSLNNEELNELVGGQFDQECAADDVSNNNSVSGCYCSFTNKSVIDNNNTIQGCCCYCDY